MLIHEIPLPVPGLLGVAFNIGPSTPPVLVGLPEEGTVLPAVAFDVCRIFNFLPVRRCRVAGVLPGRCSDTLSCMCAHTRQIRGVLALLCCLAWEKQVVMFSSRLWLLSEAGESILALLFPFSWQHVYIPVLPHSLAPDYIQVRRQAWAHSCLCEALCHVVHVTRLLARRHLFRFSSACTLVRVLRCSRST